MSLEEVVNHYGYIGILIGTFLEGETILVIAGFLAHRGYLELPVVIAIAFTGTLIGDQLYFYIGRIKGHEFIEKRPGWKSKTDRVFYLLNQYDALFILGFRFLYGIRTIAPFVLGASGVSPIRYLALNTCGALIWATLIGVLGYYFGHALEILIDEIKQYEARVITGLLLVGTTVWILYHWRENKHNQPIQPK